MSNYVVGVRDPGSRNFVIEANEDGVVSQVVGKKAALLALKKSANKHGVRQVELFQLVEYEI